MLESYVFDLTACVHEPRCGMQRKQLRDLLGLDVALQRRVGQRKPRKGRNGRKGWSKLDMSQCKS